MDPIGGEKGLKPDARMILGDNVGRPWSDHRELQRSEGRFCNLFQSLPRYRVGVEVDWEEG